MEINLTLVRSEDFGNVKCDFWRDENDNIFMTAEQLGMALDYSNGRKGIDNLASRNEYIKGSEFSVALIMRGTDGKHYNTRVFTEDGIYEVTLLAKTSKAKEFRGWIRKILKGLRTGELVLKNNLVNDYMTMSEEDRAIAYFQQMKQNKIMTPKAEAYDDFMKGKNAQTMKKVAKTLDIGRNKLFAFLRENKILMSDNLPYQKYMNRSYFEVIQTPVKMGNDILDHPQTLVTPRGIEYISKLLKNKYTT